MTAPKFDHMTVARARLLPHGELVDRLYEEGLWWNAHPPRSDAARARYRVYAECLHMIDTGALIDAAMDLVKGRPNDYHTRRPCDGPRRRP